MLTWDSVSTLIFIYLNPYMFVNKFLIMLNIVNIKIWLWIMNTIVIDNNMIIATRCLQTVKSHSRIATGKDGQNGSSRGISGL